jgi:hypothetical protein
MDLIKRIKFNQKIFLNKLSAAAVLEKLSLNLKKIFNSCQIKWIYLISIRIQIKTQNKAYSQGEIKKWPDQKG